MLGWWKDLDRILRGEATRLPALQRGTVEVPVGGLMVVLIALAMIYGACMGTFAVSSGGSGALWQLIASTVKVPALFILTLLVTFPSLYVFNALVGSRLMLASVLRLLVAALAVTVTVLASLGPIVAFFSVSTTSYPFMQLLNVVVFTVAGLLGMSFLLQTLHRLSVASQGPESPPAVTESQAEPPAESVAIQPPPGRVPGALEPIDDRMLSRHVKAVFRCWIILFGLVGAQMGWVLRPFIGNPAQPFTFFRARDANILQGIMHALGNLFS